MARKCLDVWVNKLTQKTSDRILCLKKTRTQMKTKVPTTTNKR